MNPEEFDELRKKYNAAEFEVVLAAQKMAAYWRDREDCPWELKDNCVQALDELEKLLEELPESFDKS